MANWLDTKLFTQLERTLDATNLRNKIIVNNIANIDTPDFKRSDVDFQQVLAEAIGEGEGGKGGLALKRTLLQHLPGHHFPQSPVVQEEMSTFRMDGNNVDIDLEMTRLAENTLQYNALARVYSSQLNILKQVVRE